MRKLPLILLTAFEPLVSVKSAWACGIRPETRTNCPWNPKIFGAAQSDGAFCSPQAGDSSPLANTA